MLLPKENPAMTKVISRKRAKAKTRWAVLSESLGRKEGTETENSHHWTMIQSICLFSKTAIKIHRYRHSERFGGGNT